MYSPLQPQAVHRYGEALKAVICQQHVSCTTLPLSPSLQAVHHYGEAFKALINEKMGDGIMSGEGVLCAQKRHQPAGTRILAPAAKAFPRPSPLLARSLCSAAIDFYCAVDRVKGKHGEDRVVITFNGGPLILVPAHLLTACLVWIGCWPTDLQQRPRALLLMQQTAKLCFEVKRASACRLSDSRPLKCVPTCTNPLHFPQASTCRTWSSMRRTTRRRASEQVRNIY